MPEKSWERPKYLMENMTPIELFELFFDVDIINMIIEYSILYARQKGDMNFTLTVEELKVVIAILLISGYSSLPRWRMYWEQQPDVNNAAISGAMSRNRFIQILRYLHFCDNNAINKEDKMFKVSNLWCMLNEKWRQFYHNDVSLCIDEAMVPYYGHHSSKQHIKGKPIRFGFKIWCLCDRSGYLIQAEPYQGASSTHNTILGVGASVVLDLISELPGSYDIYFDNYFTSLKLLDVLKNRGHTGTGTIRKDRVEKALLKDIGKEKRGYYHKVTDTSTGATLIRYHDNSVVTVASNRVGCNAVGRAARWSQENKKRIDITQPACILRYNTYMGGVDRLDENIAKMRIKIRLKKWYWQLFLFPLNCCVNNSWQLYRLTPKGKEEPLDLLAFTRRITLPYLQMYTRRSFLGRVPSMIRSSDKRVSEEARFDGKNHIISSGVTQCRCGLCKKNTKKICSKCSVPVHADCFVRFHTLS